MFSPQKSLFIVVSQYDINVDFNIVVRYIITSMDQGWTFNPLKFK